MPPLGGFLRRSGFERADTVWIDSVIWEPLLDLLRRCGVKDGDQGIKHGASPNRHTGAIINRIDHALVLQVRDSRVPHKMCCTRWRIGTMR